MRICKLLLFVCLMSISISACTSVISRQVRDEALPALPLQAITQNVADYTGKTVILGGYILKTANDSESSTLWVLQTPLDIWEAPEGKDKSEGRLVVSHHGFLDSKIYRTDRRVTVAGIIGGLLQEKSGLCVFPCLELNSREIYLWPEYDDYDYFLYDDPFYYEPYYGYGGFWYPYYYRYPYNYRYPPRRYWK